MWERTLQSRALPGIEPRFLSAHIINFDKSYLCLLSVFQWSSGYRFSLATAAGVQSRQMLKFLCFVTSQLLFPTLVPVVVFSDQIIIRLGHLLSSIRTCPHYFKILFSILSKIVCLTPISFMITSLLQQSVPAALLQKSMSVPNFPPTPLTRKTCVQISQPQLKILFYHCIKYSFLC